MNSIKNYIVPGLVCILILLIFGKWLYPGVLSGGDWPYLYPQAVAEVVPLSAWDTLFNNGIGMNAMPKIWFDAYALTIVKIANILTWPIFERVVWYFPYVIISFLGSFLLSKKFFDDRNFNLLSGVIYTANTYSLLVVSGGQAGVFTAYAFLPSVFLLLFRLFEYLSFKRSIVFALAFTLLILLDLRVGYMFLASAFFLSLIYLIYNRQKLLSKIVFLAVIPAIVVFLLHFFWVFPIILMGRNPASDLTDIYTSSASLSFFSFAKLENAIGLLHPNWPENLFGKVAFLRPEYIVVAFLAFMSILFVSSEKKEKRISILSLILLSIIGIFLAKGVNDPAGIIYEFFFNTVPGFVMFRDPTKWYMLVSIGYSILIPYVLLKISAFAQIKKFAILIPVLFIFFWGFLIRDSLTGVVSGTLTPRQIPANYQKLASLESADPAFYRTLWIPVYPSLAYVSNIHPAIPAVEFFQATSTANLIDILQDPDTEQILVDSAIKYVVVPEDIYGRIFLTDRKYDEKVYKQTLKEIEEIKYLKEVQGFGKIGVFEVVSPKSHFWGIGEGMKVNAQYISPTKYKVEIENGRKDDVLVFAENYDKLWEARDGKELISSLPFKVSNKTTYNSFVIPRGGDFVFEVVYKPQEWLNTSLIVSGLGLIAIVFVLLKLKK